MDARSALGEAPLLVPELEALVAEDPLREERWRLLVLALYRAHRQGDALAALRRARETLADELGVEPGPALRSLERDVLAQSPALHGPVADRWTARGTTASAAPTESPSRQAPAAGPPIGPGGAGPRDRSPDGAPSTTCGAGAGGTVLIEGSAGIGKTRLLAEAGRLATVAGLRVLSARGSELERAFGFGTVRQLFEPSLRDPARENGQRGALLGGAAAGARGVFDAVGDDERADGSFAALHGLYWLTVNLTSDGPLLLAVDDVQWCDGASLRFLAYLVKRIEGLPVLVAMTVRTGERQPTDALLDDLLLEPSATVLRPQPLSAAAAGDAGPRSAERRRRRVRPDLPPHHLGQPAAAAPTGAGAGVRGRATRRRARRHRARGRVAGGVEPGDAAAAADAADRRRGGPRGRADRSGRGPAGDRGARRAARGAGGRGAGRAEPQRDPGRRATAAVRASAGAGRRLRRPVQRRARAAPRAGGQDPAGAGRAAPSGSPPTCCSRPRAATPRRSRCCGRRRGRRSTAALPTAPSPSCGARSTSRRRPVADRVDVLIELGTIEELGRRRRRGRAPDGGVRRPRRIPPMPVRALELALVIARTQAFAVPAGRRHRVRAEPPRPRSAGRVRRPPGVAGGGADRRLHARPASRRGPTGRAGHPQVVGDGDGARMLAATLAFERMLDGDDRTGAVELARFALAGDRLLRRRATCCSGWWPSTCCWSPTRTWATCGRAPSPGPARTPPGACSRCCR